MECAVCCEMRELDTMFQFTPCMHIFCLECIRLWRIAVQQRNKGTTDDDSSMSSKSVVVFCLTVDCFSILKKPTEDRMNLRTCDNENCCRRLSFVALEHLACLHDICSSCYDEAKENEGGLNRCPVEGCGEALAESEEGDYCNGECSRPLVCGSFVVMKCCGARVCFNCFEKIFNRYYVPGDEVRCPGLCLLTREDNFEEDLIWQIEFCKAKAECKEIPLSGFPSKYECEHDVCLRCLEEMLADCKQTLRLPHCPLKSCETLYCMESTMALKELFPQFASFFSELILNDLSCPTLEDHTSTELHFIPRFSAGHRYMCVKADMNFEGLMGLVEFDRKASVAEFFREVRRELGIFSVDKVYGYYFRPSKTEMETDDELHSGEELPITLELLAKPAEVLGLSPGGTLIVDTRGMVKSKESS